MPIRARMKRIKQALHFYINRNVATTFVFKLFYNMVSCKTLVGLLQANRNTTYRADILHSQNPPYFAFWHLKTYEVLSFTANSYASIALAMVKTKQQ